MDIKFNYKIEQIYCIKEGEITLDIDSMLDNSTDVDVITELCEKLGYLKHYEIDKLKQLKSKKNIKYKITLKSKYQENLKNFLIIEINTKEKK